MSDSVVLLGVHFLGKSVHSMEQLQTSAVGDIVFSKDSFLFWDSILDYLMLNLGSSVNLQR